MDLILLRQFQKQVCLQCDFVLLASYELDRGLARRDFTGIFFALQNLLSAAANISKALWGQANSRTIERKELRDSIGIADDSPLKRVTMRNNYDHFDERLEKWFKDSKGHSSIDTSLAARSDLQFLEEIDWFRNYDRNTTDLTFWGEDFNVKEIVEEVKRILPKAREESGKPHWAAPPRN